MKTINLIKLDIYNDFQCKGATCRRTCCAGWRITVGKREYQNLKEKLKNVGSRILQRLSEESRTSRMYGEFILEEGKGCPLQSKEGLCNLQLSFGAEALPNVCAVFPRKGIRCKGQMQLSLTPACERVLEMLLEKDGPLEFIREKETLPKMLAIQFSGENGSIEWNHYIQLEEFCVLLLQAEDVFLDTRMALLGVGIHQIDTYYRNKENHKISPYIDRYLAMLSKEEDWEGRFPYEKLAPAIRIGNFIAALPFCSASSAGYSDLAQRVMQELKVTVKTKEGRDEPAFAYSKAEYEKHIENFSRFTNQHPYFLENIMVLLFVSMNWASLPTDSQSIWEQYMYACWVYSNLKFVLAACMAEDTTDEDVLDICVILFRCWVHNERIMKKVIEQLHKTGSDTPAHMAMLVQAG